MKKVLPVIVIAALIGGWWSMQRKPEVTQGSSAPATPAVNESSDTASDESSSSSSTENLPTQRAGLMPRGESDQGEETSELVDQVKPAADAYQSADEALAAVMKGAKDFDDSILEQFTEPGSDCSWCSPFYTSVRELVTNPNTPQDQKSYLAEILAISGRVENVQTLAESVKNARSSTEADIYAEALELSLGKDDVTRYLGDQLSATNDTLREASVAAITNQGTRLAVELLNKHVAERGDPDSYYSIGIGPAELIPNEDALPLVQELVQKRDEYSPAWAKSLINAGLPGLTILFDQLENSSNPSSDETLLKDAIDHVNFEDGIKDLTDRVIASNRNPKAVEFARKIQEEFSEQDNQTGGSVEP
jgi:hypothetical protein